MNIKSALQLNIPYRFHDICTIYPIDVMFVVSFNNEDDFLNLFMPYMLSHDVLSEELSNISLLKIILSEEKLFNNFVFTLKKICNTDNINLKVDTMELFFDNSTESLNEKNFDEFCDIILEMIQAKRFKKQETNEPKFETEDGRRRWLELQKNRKRFKDKQEPTKIYDIINIVQFGMAGYIPDSEIKSWTYWKLIKSYLTITNKRNYENSFEVYLQCGDSKLIEKHWSDLVKL